MFHNHILFPTENVKKVLAELIPRMVFSSPEPKAQVSFSDQNLSVVVVVIVDVVVIFSHFHLLLQNHWPNFNQTWHKASFGKGNSS